MNICLIYDCLFPWTVGGAERWYRNLGERLASHGHEVTYLTLRQWDEQPRLGGIRVIPVGPRMPLYKEGKRRILPPLRFGFGVLLHLIRHGRRYDVVHTASFPFFSLLAAAALRPLMRYRIACDWHEVWSDSYWRSYLGPLGGVGIFVQRLCAKVPQRAYTFSKLYADRLRKLGLKGEVTHLTGEFSGNGDGDTKPSAERPLTILYAGRFIPEKRVDLLVGAMHILRATHPDVRARLIGDGPTRPAIQAEIRRLDLADVIECSGFIDTDEVDTAMRAAAAIVQPSSREGYGMIVIEASARGVPAVVVAGEDNAATELVESGRNGFVAAGPLPGDIAEQILACIRGGDALRSSTRHWYRANETRVSLETSLKIVATDYERA